MDPLQTILDTPIPAAGARPLPGPTDGLPADAPSLEDAAAFAADPANLQSFQQRLDQQRGALEQGVHEPTVPGREPGAIAKGITSAITGALEAGFETKDFLLGQPAPEDRSVFRQRVEGLRDDLNAEGWGYGLIGSIAQFATGMIGLGKLLKPLEAIRGVGSAVHASRTARASYEIGKAAAVGAVAFDPHEERLSNIVQQFPALANPVTDFLAASPDDTDAEGRLKAAIESIGMDVALGGAFLLGVKALRALRNGDKEAGERLLDEAAQLEEGGGPADAPLAPQGAPLGAVDQSGAPIIPAADEAAPGAPEGGIPRFAEHVVTADGEEHFRDPLTLSEEEWMSGPRPPEVSPEEWRAMREDAITRAELEARGARLPSLDGALPPDWLDGAMRVANDNPSPLTPDERRAAQEFASFYEKTTLGELSPEDWPKSLGGHLPSRWWAGLDNSLGPEADGWPELPPQISAAAGDGDWVLRAYLAEHPEAAAALKKLFGRGQVIPENMPATSSAVAPMSPQTARNALLGTTNDNGTIELPRIDVTSEPPPIVERVDGVGQARADAAGTRFDPRVDVTPDQVSRLVDEAAADAEAIRVHGTREAAEQAGYQFGKVGTIPYSKIADPEDARAFMERVAETIEDDLNRLKGGEVLSDKRLNDLIARRAAMFGEDPAEILGVIQRAGKEATSMAANMEAGYVIANRMLQDAFQLARKIKAGALDEFGGDRAAAEGELRSRLALVGDVMAASRSMTAAAGRTLRRHRAEFAIKEADLEGLASLDGQQLVDVIEQTGGDPRKLARAANPSFMRRFLDKAQWLLVNGLLWNWPTHLVNTTTNVYMLLARPLEKVIGGAVTLRPAIAKQAMLEYRGIVSSIFDGIQAGFDAFMRGDSILAPHRTEAFAQGQPGNAAIAFRPIRGVGDLIANSVLAAKVAVGLPTRGLGALDELVKTIRYRSVVMAKASMEAEELGLEGQGFKDHLQLRLDEAFDETGAAADLKALQEAQTTTFQQELLPGTIGKQTQVFLHNVPAARLILPFIKTPTNVLRYAIKLTPGLNLAQREYREMISGRAGPEAQAQAVGQMTMGALFLSGAAVLAAEGRITGGGPTDPKIAAELRAKGWQPYSVIWEDAEGKKHYFPYGRFDPIGLVFGLVADTADIMQNQERLEDTEGLATAIAVAFAKNLGNRTYLLSMKLAIDAFSDPENRMNRWAGNLASGFLPFSSLLRSVNPDPYLREARTLVDNALGRMPGYSETLPPRRDALGEPITVRRGLWSHTPRGDAIDAELERIALEQGLGITPPAPTRSGVDLRDLVLEDGKTTAYDRYQELAARPPGLPPLRETLNRLVADPRYQQYAEGEATTPGTKLSAISGITGKYRAAAFALLLKESPIVREAVTRRRREAREAIRAKRADEAERQNLPGLGTILDAFGQR